MTITEAKRLKPGDVLRHNGIWAHRVGTPQDFTVTTVDEQHLRVSNAKGKVSLYNLQGCSLFVTKDFLDQVTHDNTRH